MNEVAEADGSKSSMRNKTSKTLRLGRGKRNLSDEQKAAAQQQRRKLPVAGSTRRVANAGRARESDRKVAHHGCMLSVAGRFSKKRLALPMKPRSTR